MKERGGDCPADVVGNLLKIILRLVGKIKDHADFSA